VHALYASTYTMCVCIACMHTWKHDPCLGVCMYVNPKHVRVHTRTHACTQKHARTYFHTHTFTPLRSTFIHAHIYNTNIRTYTPVYCIRIVLRFLHIERKRRKLVICGAQMRRKSRFCQRWGLYWYQTICVTRTMRIVATPAVLHHKSISRRPILCHILLYKCRTPRASSCTAIIASHALSSIPSCR
jgi:hypothetical protein